jgi:branched-chain amino acid transport system substrate-binding protein
MIMKKIGIMGLVVLLCLAVMPGAVAAGEKVVNIMFSGMLTGPGATIVVPLFQGLEDYIRELNTKGGIDGVEVKLITTDSRYDVARSISFYQRHRRTPRLLAMVVCGTPDTYALNPLMTRDKVVLFSASSGASLKRNPGYVFFSPPSYQDVVGADVDWILADWKKKGKSGMPTVGLMAWQGSAGKDAVNGSVQYAQQLGVKFLPPEFFPPGSLKYDTWLIRLADQGADYIIIVGTDPDPVFILRDAHGLGLTKKIQFVSWLFGFMPTLGLRLAESELVEGAIATSYFLMGDEAVNHPSAELFTKYHKKPRSEMNGMYLSGVSFGKVIEKAIGMALKDVGYDKINGEAFYQALQKVQGDVTEGMMGRVDLGPKARNMSDTVKFYRVTKGKLEPISGWVKTPDCVSLGEFK